MIQKFLLRIIKGKEKLYNIALKKSAEKDLDKIDEPMILHIIDAIDNLRINPRNLNVKKLVNRGNEYRLRIGDYRVLFQIDEKIKIITVARVLHRKEAYR